MTTEDPWKDIQAPIFPDLVNARRVDAELEWDFFWGRGPDRSIYLTLAHTQEASPRHSLPRLRGIEMSVTTASDEDKRILSFKLLDLAQRDIFYSLCRDIVAATRQAETEPEAVSIALARTWRWHYLLRGGGATLLSPEEQKGLIGEMLVLERLLLPRIGPVPAVTAWRGPLGAPKDFQVGQVAIEVKSHSAGMRDVTIANEDQLDESNIETLLLCAIELNEELGTSGRGINVRDLAQHLTDQLSSLDPRAAELFEGRLEAAGLRIEDDYSESMWLEGANALYSVSENFPRLLRKELRQGVSKVRYVISLVDCEPYMVSPSHLDAALKL